MPRIIKPVRVINTLPADWVAALDAEAERLGIPRAELIRRGIRRVLPSAVRKELSQPAPVGRPKDCQESV